MLLLRTLISFSIIEFDFLQINEEIQYLTFIFVGVVAIVFLLFEFDDSEVAFELFHSFDINNLNYQTNEGGFKLLNQYLISLEDLVLSSKVLFTLIFSICAQRSQLGFLVLF